MKTKLIALIFVLIATSVVQAAPYNPKDEIKKESDWIVTTVVLNQGTSSQVVIGKIQFKGTEVIGEKGHLIETPLGRYIWNGAYDEGRMRGWILSDYDLHILEVIPAELSETVIGGLYNTKKKG